MINLFTRYRFFVYSTFATGVLILMILHMVRHDAYKPIKALASIEDYEPINHEIHVYTGTPLSLRDTANMIVKDNIVSELSRGQLFVPFEDTSVQRYEIWNMPNKTIRFYEIQKIKVFEKSEYVTRYALHSLQSYKQHIFTDKKKHFRHVYGLHDNSETYAAYVYHNLKMCGWDTDSKNAFSCEGYGYEGEGYYYTTLVEDVELYDTKGNVIGSLPEKTKVYFTPNMPIAVGVNNPQLFRIVQYKIGDISERGTYFIQGFNDNGTATIHTGKVSTFK